MLFCIFFRKKNMAILFTRLITDGLDVAELLSPCHLYYGK